MPLRAAVYDRSIEYSMRRAEEALVAGRLNEASTVAEALRPLAPNNSRLTFLNTQIEKEQSRQNADASQRAANEARQTQIRAALDQMNERMRRGALLDPAANSAVSHFRAAEQIGPGDPAVRAARESLVAALLTAADSELTARRVAGSRRMVDAAATLNSSAPGLDVMRRRIDEFGEQQAAASAAAAARSRARRRGRPRPGSRGRAGASARGCRARFGCTAGGRRHHAQAAALRAAGVSRSARWNS